MLYILMYPVLILTQVPDFLDTSGMGVTEHYSILDLISFMSSFEWKVICSMKRLS
jgi:hypothetical protein